MEWNDKQKEDIFHLAQRAVKSSMANELIDYFEGAIMEKIVRVVYYEIGAASMLLPSNNGEISASNIAEMISENKIDEDKLKEVKLAVCEMIDCVKILDDIGVPKSFRDSGIESKVKEYNMLLK